MNNVALETNTVNTVYRKGFVISKRVILYILFFFPFIQQRTMEELPSYIIVMYRAGAAISSSIIYINFIIKRQRLMRKEIGFFAVFWFIYLFSTLLHCPQNLLWVLYNAYIMFALTLFIFVKIRKFPVDILKALSFIYAVFITLNWILDIVFPDGLYQVTATSYHTAHLLGDDNAIVFVALPGLVICTCYSIIKNEKVSWFCYFMMFITEYTLVRIWSVSAMLVVGIYIGLTIYVTKVKEINYKVLVATLVLTLLMAFLGPLSSWFQSIIINVLHKTVTLSGRTIVWREALLMIRSKPLLGYGGYYQIGRFAVNFGRSYSSHTPYLQMLIDGGIVLLSVFIMIVGASFAKMKKEKANLVMYILGIGAMCMMINYITEQVVFFHLFIIFSFMINIEYLPTIEKSDLKGICVSKEIGLERRNNSY